MKEYFRRYDYSNRVFFVSIFFSICSFGVIKEIIFPSDKFNNYLCLGFISLITFLTVCYIDSKEVKKELVKNGKYN